LENIEITENNEAVFECQLSKEDAQVEWWFRGMPIIPSQHHLIASRGYIRQLIIPKIGMNDEGEYSIRVDNKNTSTAQLFVKGKLRNFLIKNLFFFRIEQPIIFRRPLRSQVIEESSSASSTNAVFECELNKPLKQMLWFKSNVQHIIPSDKYQIESFANGHIHRLTVRDVILRDDGEYTASTGLNTSQARLTVEPLMPIFIVPLMDARANTRELVKLSCETGNSCQVVWMHRGKKIIENSYKYTIGKQTDQNP
jgi:titin